MWLCLKRFWHHMGAPHWKRRVLRICYNAITVGQRKKVTAVTFFRCSTVLSFTGDTRVVVMTTLSLQCFHITCPVCRENTTVFLVVTNSSATRDDKVSNMSALGFQCSMLTYPLCGETSVVSSNVSAWTFMRTNSGVAGEISCIALICRHCKGRLFWHILTWHRYSHTANCAAIIIKISVIKVTLSFKSHHNIQIKNAVQGIGITVHYKDRTVVLSLKWEYLYC